MNILNNNPAASLHIAHQTVADRLDEARVRRRTRALRSERRAAQAAARPAAERPTSLVVGALGHSPGCAGGSLTSSTPTGMASH